MPGWRNLVDALASKASGLWPCRFESCSGRYVLVFYSFNLGKGMCGGSLSISSKNKAFKLHLLSA